MTTPHSEGLSFNAPRVQESADVLCKQSIRPKLTHVRCWHTSPCQMGK